MSQTYWAFVDGPLFRIRYLNILGLGEIEVVHASTHDKSLGELITAAALKCKCDIEGHNCEVALARRETLLSDIREEVDIDRDNEGIGIATEVEALAKNVRNTIVLAREGLDDRVEVAVVDVVDLAEGLNTVADIITIVNQTVQHNNLRVELRWITTRIQATTICTVVLGLGEHAEH